MMHSHTDAHTHADSLNRIYRESLELAHIIDKHALDSRNDGHIHAKLFYAERNAYLTGMSLFLSLYVAWLIHTHTHRERE
jgi:hypothetical protein